MPSLSRRAACALAAGAVAAALALTTAGLSYADDPDGGREPGTSAPALPEASYGLPYDGPDDPTFGEGNPQGPTPDAAADVAARVADDEPLDFQNCDDSALGLHDGFQSADAICVPTVFGEQSAQEHNPSLLIVDSPATVRPGEDIVLEVSTRNLIRDRFLPAGGGGYYLEPSTLTDGIQRGHFHVACQSVDGDLAAATAPQPDRNFESFQAVEDGEAGTEAVTVSIVGLDAVGDARCTAWAGDGSHRTPMMAFANQIPAIDSVRLEVAGEPVAAEDQHATPHTAGH